MGNDNVKIETYRGVDLFYNKDNGKIEFEYENLERTTKYVFEAKEIIDTPAWQECDLTGFFIDGTFNDYIGLATAKRKDIRNLKPDWLYKGKFDTKFTNQRYGDVADVFIANAENITVYNKFLEQEKIVNKEERILRAIIGQLRK